MAWLAGAALAMGQVPPDFSTIEIKATRIAEKFHTLEGQGGTIGMLSGPEGVLLVDTQFASLSVKITAAIRKITPHPVRYVVITHVHGDHSGGSANFGKAGATIVAREELRLRLLNATAPEGLPKQTYRGRMTLFLNGEEVRLIGPPNAHTDGDTMVYFPGLDILMTGDVYRSIQFPTADRGIRGSVKGLLDALGLVIGMAGPKTKIIPGHGPIVDRMAVMAHRDLALTIRDRVAALVAQGKTEAEVVASKVTADLEARIQQPGTTGERFVRQVYAELKEAR